MLTSARPSVQYSLETTCAHPGALDLTQLRHPRFGTRIELCSLLVHIEFGEEPHLWEERETLRAALEERQARSRLQCPWSASERPSRTRTYA